MIAILLLVSISIFVYYLSVFINSSSFTTKKEFFISLIPFAMWVHYFYYFWKRLQ